MSIDSKIEHFLDKHPPLNSKELEHLLDYVENIDDLELRNRARLLANRCEELERTLRARETHLGRVSGGELRYDIMDYFMVIFDDFKNMKTNGLIFAVSHLRFIPNLIKSGLAHVKCRVSCI